MTAIGRPLVAEGTDPVAASAAPVRAAAPPVRDSLPLKLATFVALAGFAASHWAALVRDAPAGRTLALVALVSAGAAALGAIGRLGLPRGVAPAVGLVVAIVMVLAGLCVAGLPVRLLAPANWGELAEGLDRGLEGVQAVDWPYGGTDVWIRRTILLGAPLLLGLASALAFFPARRGAAGLRAAGLALLLVAYGTAVTEHDQGAPLLRGLVLLMLVAAWLWLPRMAPREAATGAVVVAAVGLLSVPMAAVIDGERPWWDYRAWDWFGGGRSIAFDWDHSYGPLDWPRDGTTLLNVESDRQHYWKAEVLDRFDGFRWERSRTHINRDMPGLSDLRAAEGRTWDPGEVNPRWNDRLEVTVRSLSSDLIVGAGISYRVEGAGTVSYSADGTTLQLGDPLERGDTYTVRFYEPDPAAGQMRAAADETDPDLLPFTAVNLPNAGESALDATTDAAADARRVVQVPLRGTSLGDKAAAGAALGRSDYARTYELARSLTVDEPTTYDAVKAVENHLQRGFRYSERPPSADVPLDAFLFEEKVGYCQQYSGAMALLLRMSGIPARVAAGFSPGSFNRDTREYRVRDLDAHSWVEVYFSGIGWVPFDPTPAASPAESQSSGLGVTSAARGDAAEVRGDGAGAPSPDRAGDPGASAGGGDGGGRPLWPLVVLVAGGAGGLAWYRFVRSRRALEEGDMASAQLAELRRALVRLGYAVPAGTTLLGLERRLDRAVGPAAAGYAARLRAHRYDPRRPDAPGPAERRALRRELTARGGPAARIRGLRAIPPGGPRPVVDRASTGPGFPDRASTGQSL